MVYKIYRWYVLSILIAWVSLNAWAWWVLGSIETCNLGFRLLGFIVWGCSMSILSLVLVIPPISDSNKISWEEVIPIYCFIPSLLQTFVLIYISLDIPTAVSGEDIIATAGIGISIMLNIAILTLSFIINKTTRFIRYYTVRNSKSSVN